MTSPGFNLRPAADALAEVEKVLFGVVVISLSGAALFIAAYLLWTRM